MLREQGETVEKGRNMRLKIGTKSRQRTNSCSLFIFLCSSFYIPRSRPLIDDSFDTNKLLQRIRTQGQTHSLCRKSGLFSRYHSIEIIVGLVHKKICQRQ